MQDSKTTDGKRNGAGTAYASFAIGAVTSVAANVAHAASRGMTEVGPGPVIASAFAPLSLLLVVEMLLRTRHVGGFLGGLRWVGAAVVAGVAAVVSYGHMRELLLSYGESDLVAYILPLAVDGLMVVASVVLAAPAARARRVETAEEVPGVDGGTGEAEVPAAPMPDAVPVPVPKPRAVPRAVTELAATADERADARTAWLAEHDVGVTLTGKDLAARYGKSERWGRDRVREARAELAATETTGV